MELVTDRAALDGLPDPNTYDRDRFVLRFVPENLVPVVDALPDEPRCPVGYERVFYRRPLEAGGTSFAWFEVPLPPYRG